MMLIDSSRIVKLLEREKDQFLQQYADYLDQISQGDLKVKNIMAKKDRVLLVVLTQFLAEHAKDIRAPIGNNIKTAEALMPVAKRLLKANNAKGFITQEQD